MKCVNDDMQGSDEPMEGLRRISNEQRSAGIPMVKTIGGMLLANPRAGSAHIGSVLNLTGPLDTQALRRCQLMLIQRHEALRTVYKPQGAGRPLLMMVQQVSEPFLHFREAEAGSEAEARDIASAAWNGEYDIETGPLMRLQVWNSACGHSACHCALVPQECCISMGGIHRPCCPCAVEGQFSQISCMCKLFQGWPCMDTSEPALGNKLENDVARSMPGAVNRSKTLR